jgi:hypothetical protein
MAQVTNYENIIKIMYDTLRKWSKTSKWNDDATLVKYFKDYYKALYMQVHKIYAPLKSANSENLLREIIQKYVIGYSDDKKGITYIGALELINSKLSKINNNIKRNKNVTVDQLRKIKEQDEIIKQYQEIYDDFMALASFRSYKHYCFYMQDVFGIKLWSENERAFSGYWFYAGRMVLDGVVKFLEKQLPTGTGKSLSDCFMHSWIFGIDINNDVFKVCGNDKFTDDCFENVVDKLMCSPKYAKVFPYYAQFECKRELMFSFCSRKDLKFAITGSVKSTNLRIATKLAETSGVRAKFLFIDDICQSDDLMSQMKKDIDKFRREWFRRNYNLREFYVVASGTSYSQFDILSYLKREMGYMNAVRSPINEFTWISKSDYITKDGVSVFVKVPALDDKDESVFPTIRDTYTCRQLREQDFATFMAMEQQEPLPPEGSPFYFEKLRQYNALPKIGENGRGEDCVAVLDTKRRGTDFLSMPILFQANDPEREGLDVYFLVDWLYDDRPMKDLIPFIANKIIQHKITRLVAERNTEECIATLIEQELEKQGYTSCVVEDIYSTEPKDKRILAAEGDIKSRIIFPRYGMYSPISDIGKALLNVYGYSYNGKVKHDDAPDSLALFAKRFIMNNYAKMGQISFFSR